VILYHFTSLGHVPLILQHGGLEKGGVMVGENGEQNLNATWLTTDSSPEHEYGLGFGQLTFLPEQYREKGDKPWTECVDKRAVRISVKIPSHDRKLKHWIMWIQGRLGKAMLDWYIEDGGGRQRAEKWYIYQGLIPCSSFLKIEIRGNRNEWVEATEEQLDSIRPHETKRSYYVEPAPAEH